MDTPTDGAELASAVEAWIAESTAVATAETPDDVTVSLRSCAASPSSGARA